MAPPKKSQPTDQTPNLRGPIDPTEAVGKTPAQPKTVIIEARLAAHVASALPTLGTNTTLRLANAKPGIPGVSRSGKIVDSMTLTPGGLEVVIGTERILIGHGSWVALIEADR